MSKFRGDKDINEHCVASKYFLRKVSIPSSCWYGTSDSNNEIRNLTWSSDEKFLAATTGNSATVVFETRNWKPVALLADTVRDNSVPSCSMIRSTFSNNDEFIAVPSMDGSSSSKFSPRVYRVDSSSYPNFSDNNNQKEHKEDEKEDQEAPPPSSWKLEWTVGDLSDPANQMIFVDRKGEGEDQEDSLELIVGWYEVNIRVFRLDNDGSKKGKLIWDSAKSGGMNINYGAWSLQYSKNEDAIYYSDYNKLHKAVRVSPPPSSSSSSSQSKYQGFKLCDPEKFHANDSSVLFGQDWTLCSLLTERCFIGASHARHTLALDRFTGQELWRIPTYGPSRGLSSVWKSGEYICNAVSQVGILIIETKTGDIVENVVFPLDEEQKKNLQQKEEQKEHKRKQKEHHKKGEEKEEGAEKYKPNKKPLVVAEPQRSDDFDVWDASCSPKTFRTIAFSSGNPTRSFALFKNPVVKRTWESARKVFLIHDSDKCKGSMNKAFEVWNVLTLAILFLPPEF